MGSNSQQKKARLPGPLHIPWLGWRLQGLSMLSDPMRHFMNVYHRHGLLSAWDPGHPKHVCAFGPTLYREIVTNPETFIVDAFREGNIPKGSPMERLSFGLMSLNGDVHKRHRSLMQPAFRPRVVDAYHQTIVSVTQAELDTWQIGETRHLDYDLMRLITYISMRTMFGLETDEDVKRLQILIKQLISCAASPTTLLLPFNIPGTSYHKMLQLSTQIEAIIRGLIRQKRNQSEPTADVLSRLIHAVDDESGQLTEDELISEAYTVLCHESSAATLTWCLFLLDRHPTILMQVIDELDGILKGDAPSVEQLNSLTLLDNVIKETVRLFPPAAFSLRYTSMECELGGATLPKDAMIFLSAYVSHRLPDVFDEPLQFNPFRWETLKLTPYEYMAFGAGTHSCMGKYFAMLEIKIILSMLLQRYRPSLTPNARIDRGMRISFVPKHHLPVQLFHPKEQIKRAPFVGNIHDSVTIT